eukprot:NODE_2873_length_1099_cov_26.160000_g2635_i0.p1 GENE.NODE_2873_length_1099_cov_26.160000_g2635_i0~~NODE_2873_length_1099_cov_26.160000_g2635_i0.p1  ORF type:complete len:259 (-),score=54.64 NODE_2873_length_1099_cov_26.160000_g2635_i0:321-998(-)
MAAGEGICLVNVSLDDFYLTHEELRAVAKQNAANRLLAKRGNPGTHDVPLMVETLRRLTHANSMQDTVAVPRFEKFLHGGEGDRAQEADWDVIRGPVDLVVLEGWCLGFQPMPVSALIDPDLLPINTALEKFDWRTLLDALVVFKVCDIGAVFRWRLEAEHEMLRTAGSGLTDEQVKTFVDAFMPAYKQYLPKLYSGHVLGNAPNEIQFTINSQRQPVASQESHL